MSRKWPATLIAALAVGLGAATAAGAATPTTTTTRTPRTTSVGGDSAPAVAIAERNTVYPAPVPPNLSKVIGDTKYPDGIESVESVSDTVSVPPTAADLSAIGSSPSAAASPARGRNGYGCYERSVQDKVKEFFVVTAYTNTINVRWCGYKSGSVPGRVTSARYACSAYTGPFFYHPYEDCHSINHNSDVTGEAQSRAHFLGQAGLTHVLYDSNAGLIWHGNGQSRPYAHHDVLLVG